MGLTAVLIGTGIIAGGSLAGAAIGSRAAGKAADVTATAAENAARATAEASKYAVDVNKQASDEAIALQREQYAKSLELLQPWMSTGTNALTALNQQLGLPGQYADPAKAYQDAEAARQQAQSAAEYKAQDTYNQALAEGKTEAEADALARAVLTPLEEKASTDLAAAAAARDEAASALNAPGGLMRDWQGQFVAPEGAPEAFRPPTVADMGQDPGFQFRLQEGQRALERSAASRGTLLSGGTLKELANYSQGLASQEYGNVYGRNLTSSQQAQNEYAQNYNRALGEYQQGYSQFQNTATNRFNRLANLAGMGQTTATNLSGGGMQLANNVGNLLTGNAQNAGNITINAAQNEGNWLTGAAGARGTGYLQSANMWNSALGNIGSNVMDQYTMAKLLNPTPTTNYAAIQADLNRLNAGLPLLPRR